MLITGVTIHTMDGPMVPEGFVRIEGSRIAEVGPMTDLPDAPSGPVVDGQGGHLLPGFIDAHCHVGIAGLRWEGLNEDVDPCTPHIRGLDGVNPMDEYFSCARRAGVTCVVTGPGSGNPIAGQLVAMKTAGRIVDQMVLRAPAAMKFALGENPTRTHGKARRAAPATRMATAALIREQLSRAAEYRFKKERSELEGTQPPEFDARLDALSAVLDYGLPAHFHAHRADDIVTAVRLAHEFCLDLTIVHGTEGRLIADFLAKEGVPVITGPFLTDKSKQELANLAVENTAELAAAGVQVAVCTDHPETPIQYLRLCAALTASAGMDEEEALAAITINAACIAGVDDRLGSVTVGKDADLVLMSGPPFGCGSHVRNVWIDGREVEL